MFLHRKLKIDEVQNGWVVEFYPAINVKDKSGSKIEKHIAYAAVPDLLMLLEALLLREEAPQDLDEEPKASEHSPE